MKIVITANTSWFIYHFFLKNICELIKNGFDVEIIAPKDECSQKLVNEGCQYNEIVLERSGSNLINEISSIVAYYRLIRRIKPICVLNFTIKSNIYSTIACKLLNVKVINTVAGLGHIFIAPGIKSSIGKLLLYLTQPLADHIIFQNEYDRGVYLKHKIAKEDSTSRTYGIGVDLQRFRLSEAPDDGVVRFIVVSRMLYTKGIEDFVIAARIVLKHLSISNVNKVEFSLLGAPDIENPESISLDKLNLWHHEGVINYLGKTEDVFSIVKNYDCVVLPSYYKEGVPQCLIEAAAMGKPIITTNTPGCRDAIISEKSGFLVEPREPVDLANGMLKMIETGHASRIEMGLMGRYKAERDFSYQEVSRHYLEKINSLINLG